MENSITNSFFSNFHTDSDGGVFISNSSCTLYVIGCAFHDCTATISAACFLFMNGTISVSKTCFSHSGILTQTRNIYGNAFHIKNAVSATYQELSANLCGYDSTCSDSTFVTTTAPLTSSYVNCTNCASFEGCNSLAINDHESTSSVKYLISISPHGFGTINHFIIQRSNGKLDYFVFINSTAVTSIFWVDGNDKLECSHGIFIDPGTNPIVNNDRFSQVTFTECISNEEIQDVSDTPSISNDIQISYKLIIKAEECYAIKNHPCTQNINHTFQQLQHFLICISIMIII